MKVFDDFVAGISDPLQRSRTQEVLAWVAGTYPRLEPVIKWKQPMFTDHGTFIIGFSVARHHLAVAPEKAAIDRFSDQVKQAGYTHSQQLVRIPWTGAVDFGLLEKIVEFNIAGKKDCASFWRKE